MAKINNDNKKLAQAILENQGKEYEDWLNEKHQEIIVSNVKLLSEALKYKKDNRIKTNESRN